ncbi:MAG: ABC transporter ATP-binding protein [Balneolaceae bacterium]|nr:ABC transporter ATP-binding protein [Balneolaceae bacterium]
MIEYLRFTAWYPSHWQKDFIIESSDFVIENGKITALTGLNGSGKTTLIKTILGLNPNGTGTLMINSEPQKTQLLPDLFFVGYAPEMNSETGNKTCSEILKLQATLNKTVKKNDSKLFGQKYLIEALQLDSYAGLPYNKLSKGTKKRVNIAMALLGKPEVLILDEPFEGLDQEQRKRLKSLLMDIKKDRYILISSHELMELNTFCDDFLLVKEKLVLQASYNEIYK